MPQETFTPQALRTKAEALGLPIYDTAARKACIELTPQARRNAERRVFMQIAKDRLAELEAEKAAKGEL